MANSLPFLSGLNLSVTLGEEAVNLAPQLIDADVTFVDADNNFNGGTLVLSGLAAGDILAIRNEGTDAGEIGVDGADITYEGVVIGTVAGGTGGVALSVTFNASATSAGVDALIQNLTYQNLSDTPVFARTLELTITDAAGAQAVTPVVMQEAAGAANPFNGMDVGSFGTPSFVDLDGDGDLDALSGELNGTLKYFENTGTGIAPAYVERTGAANPFNSVDVGDESAPSFADLDGDGDLDALSGELNGTLKYFENTGTGVAPAYVEQTGPANPFNGIDVGYRSTPGFADLDGDGDLDAVSGENYGTLKYYENTGTGVAPAYVARTGAANPFDGIDVGVLSKPSFADLDDDGDLDAVIGDGLGTLQYFENTGNGVAPAYVLRSGAANPFNGIDVGDTSAPSFVDLDGDGDLDAVVGEQDGVFNYYENTRLLSAPGDAEFAVRTGAANPFNGIDVGIWSIPSLADLDGDGDLDAVIGENYGTLKYFENTGTGAAPAYVERTGPANPFNGVDVGGNSAPAFADLDGDGDLDAVSGEISGTLKYFENTGTGVAPVYVEQTGAANPFNGVNVGYFSAPAFADLDGDGDIDAVVGASNGTLKYYENTGTSAAPVYVELTGASNPLNGMDVGLYSVPSFADLDGDGDLDAVSGVDNGTLKYFENTGTGVAPAFIERTGAANPFNGVDVGGNSAPAFTDLDGDGDRDALIGEYDGNLNYYENIDTGAAPVYVEQTGAANPFNGILDGNRGTPSFADLDGDGDLDAVIGEVNGNLNYYENTGTGVSPAYVTRTGAANPFNGVDVGVFSTPSFADLDGDGDFDVVSGENFGTLKYYENTGTGVAPAYVERTGAANPFDGTDVSYQSRPSFADLDGDGDLDAVIGEFYGTLKYFENTGTGVAPAYVARTGAANPFNGIDVGDQSSPSFADLDGDGDLDALSGEHYGTLSYFENTGTGVAPAYVVRTGAANPFNGIDFSYDSAPSFADLDGDGDLDALIGENDGNLNYYENTGPGGFKFVLMVTQHADPSEGADVMNGTDGDDSISMLGGTDTVAGGAGNDTLDGGAGDDSLDGGLNADMVSYTSAASGVTVSLALQGAGQNTGASGNDTLTGFENLSGSGFNDTLTGDSGANVLDGGAGDDSLVGGAGDDHLTGGLGNDILTGGADIDWADFSADANAVTVNLGTNSATGQGTDTLGGIENVLGSGAADNITGDANGNVLDSGAGDDTIVGGDGNDSLSGGLGNDSLLGGNGSDSLIAGAGNDTLFGNTGDDTLSGGDDSDSLFGGQGNDAVAGDAGDDNIQGNLGDDVMDGGAGNDTLHGGQGNDTISGGVDEDSLVGGQGNDTLSGGDGNDTLSGIDGNDTLDGVAGNDRELGSLGADSVLGGAGNDTLYGGDGTGLDTLDTGDVLDGGDGNDSVLGGFGNDTVSGAAGADTAFGNLGDDSLSGGSDDDNLYGGQGNDAADGGDGVDHIEGNLGDDTLLGGLGNDAFVHGGQGNDWVYGNTGDDTLFGGAGNDQVFGGQQNDVVSGGDGNDNEQGNLGDDVMAGDAGADTLHGGQGNDTLAGGIGNDSLVGGLGNDLFRYDAATLNTGDVGANQADIIGATAGDLTSMLGLNDEITINGTALSALTADLAVGNTLNATNNIAFTGGVLQIDLDGDDVFNAANDFQVAISGITTVTYNATDDMFHLA